MQLAVAQPCQRPAGCRAFTAGGPRRFVGLWRPHAAPLMLAMMGAAPSRRCCRRCCCLLPSPASAHVGPPTSSALGHRC